MKKIVTIAILMISAKLFAYQNFTLRLEPATITATPMVHSGTFGEYSSKWFFIGGRKNGLHGFLPPSGFPEAGINDSIFIVDPMLNQQWSASTHVLPDSIREAITTSNMEFYLNDSMLYMVGGYGWNENIGDFITFPTLTAINMKGLMNAVINSLPIENYFRQLTDTSLAICGAHLQKMDSTYYLVFGHRYDGHYDRTDTVLAIARQTYSYEIRKFQIADNGTNFSITNYSALRDTTNFRRRDFNLIPMYDLYRGEGLIAYSGVFQPHVNQPYLTAVEIFKDTVIVRSDFNQNLSQYHSAVCAMYDSSGLLQHHLFFGGLSMYYVDTLTQQTVHDSLVPFVRTVSDVVRDFDFAYHEINAGIRMPALLGTNAYFFYDLQVPMYKKHFVDLNSLAHHQQIGYIVGGIESMDLNIADNNPNAQSFASPRVFEVYIDTIEDTTTVLSEINNEVLNFLCYPNPANEKTQLEFELKKNEIVKIELLDMKGSLVQTVCNKTFDAGKQKLVLDLQQLAKGVYNCVITVNRHRKSLRVQKE